MQTMRSTHYPHYFLCAALGAALCCAGRAQAQEAKPDVEASFNAALTSDYRYRGLTQSRFRPALQAGADFVHTPTGLYAGAWASSIRWIADAGGDADLELDLYAGKRGTLAGAFAYDAGVLRYVYPSNGLRPSANTTEVYGQLGYGAATVKYSHAVTNLFGFADSKHSGYLDVSANLELAKGTTLNLHAGRQRVRRNGAASYNDYKIGVTHDFGVASGQLAVVGTDADKNAYLSPANGRFMGRAAPVLTVSRVF